MPDIQLIDHSVIHQKLDAAASHVERARIISRYLCDKLFALNKHEPLINEIIHTHIINEKTRSFEITRQHKISERQLERKFLASIGVSPKKFQRIIRFEKALHLLRTASYSDLTAIAYDLNYTDQAHFIKDFKTFSGQTPYEFVKYKSVGSESSSFIYQT